MMKKIILGLFLLCSLQIYGQQQKDLNFGQKVFYAGFTADDKNNWPQVNNEFYFFLIKDSSYIVECTNSDKKAYLLPKGSPRLDSFKIEAELMPDRKKEDNGVIGIALDIQDKLSGGYLVQINSKRQYRVVSIEGSGNYVPVSNKGKAEGWAGYKPASYDANIHVAVIQAGTKVYVNIDHIDVFSFDNKIAQAGQCGMFISGVYKSKAKNFTVYKAVGGKVSTGSTVGSNPQNSNDINTLNSALLDCRNDNKQQAANIETLNQEIAQARKKNGELQTYISQNLDMKLQDELKKQKEKADKLQADNDKLQKEMGDLRELKKTIDNNKDGDLIMVLSGNLKAEQEKNAALEKKIKDLTKKKAPKK